MNKIEHLIHGIWPIIVVGFHRIVLDKLLAPIGRAIWGMFKPTKLLDKAIEAVEEKVEKVIEDKVENKVKEEIKNKG